MIRVVIESPYAGDVADNVAFARAVCRWAVLRGYAPYASHLFYTQPGILDDHAPEERQLGIDAGLEWGNAANEVWFCLPDDGREPSPGMVHALARYRRARRFASEYRFPWDGSELGQPTSRTL